MSTTDLNSNQSGNQGRLICYEKALKIALSPSFIELEDQSHLHKGHEGAKDGRGHYRVKIASEAFRGLSKVRRHQLVYDALKPWFSDEIHALIINAFIPEEL